ncbi:MAG: type II toxin-antitoxin system VapC family toxin [Terrimicrobiaceae bacterium]
MNTYIDTSLFVKSFVFEVDSLAAVEIIEAVGEPFVFSHLHQIEIPNAILFKRFRGEITRAQETTALRAFEADVANGRFSRPAYDIGAVFTRAEQLSARHSGDIGTRSLDLLHVAAALEASCTAFASYDERQRKAAFLSGLKIIPSENAPSRKGADKKAK